MFCSQTPFYHTPRQYDFDNFLTDYHLHEQEQLYARRQAELRAQQAAVARARAQRAAYLQRQAERQAAYEEYLRQRDARIRRHQQQQAELLQQRQRQTQLPFFLFHPSTHQPEPAVKPVQPAPSRFSSPEDAVIVIQRRFRDHLASKQRLFKLSQLEEDFNRLKGDFQLPEQLDFNADNHSLLYNAHNAPLHAYEDSLTKLLTRLDDIPSNGSRTIKAARKAIVKAIEKELASLDTFKNQQLEVFKQQQQQQSEKVHAQPIETVDPSELPQLPASTPSSASTSPLLLPQDDQDLQLDTAEMEEDGWNLVEPELMNIEV